MIKSILTTVYCIEKVLFGGLNMTYIIRDSWSGQRQLLVFRALLLILGTGGKNGFINRTSDVFKSECNYFTKDGSTTHLGVSSIAFPIQIVSTYSVRLL